MRGRTALVRARRLAAVLGIAVLAAGYMHAGDRNAGAAPAGDRAYDWTLPKWWPEPRVPSDNPMTAEKVALGRFLFYEKRLSGNGTQSCGSCHMQSLAFTDGRAQAVGSTGEVHPRSSQSLANVGYNATLTWANPSLVTLERQMEVVLFGTTPVEFGVNDANKGRILRRLTRDPRYRRMFARAFPGRRRPVTWPNIVKAIASFERTMISANSRYDRWLRGTATLSASEERGKDLFFGEKAECHHCHTGLNLNDQFTYKGARAQPLPFHNTGLYNVGGTGAFPEPNRGVFELTGDQADMGAFRAPSLRNVGVTAPYMHDGSITTLEEVLDFYAAGGRDVTEGPNAGDGRLNPHKDPLVSAIDLTEQEREDIVAFLGTLTDEAFLRDPALSDPFSGRRR